MDQDPKKFLASLERRHKDVASGGITAAKLLAATQEAYRWARRDRRTRDFVPADRSGDAAIYESDRLMHARVRSEEINNSQIRRAGQALTDLVIGNGITTFSDPFDATFDMLGIDITELDDELRYAFESDDLFEEWSQDPKQFDAEGKKSWSDVQRLVFSENVAVGDAFLLRVMRTDPQRIVPLCYQVIEREQLDRTRDRPAGVGQNKIVNGIELDRYGCEVAFHVYDAHPFDDFSSAAISKSTRIPAARMIHLFLFRRPSQSIGCTWFDAIGQNVFDRDKFIGAEIQTAAKAALLALIVKRNNPYTGTLGLDDDDSDLDEYGNDEVKLGSSPLAMEVGKDEDVKMVESVRPTDTAESFIGILDHDTAAGVGISYQRLTGRYENMSYSAARAAQIDEDAHIRPLQGWFARSVAIPVRREFNALAVGSGLFRTLTPAEFLADPRKWNAFDFFGSGRQLLDTVAETESATARLRTLQSTLKAELGARGQHWLRVMRQQALERRMAAALGVPVDFSKGNGGNVNDQQKQEATSIP